MFRRRLRPMPTAEELAALYAEPHDHRRYGYGHDLRVRHTISLGEWFAQSIGARSIADLSCGNGVIASALAATAANLRGGGRDKHQTDLYLGDYAGGVELPTYPGSLNIKVHDILTGPLEETIDQLPARVDLFVLSETVEHLDDPEAVLERLSERCRGLLLSTPIGEDDLGNPEHLHGWDQEAVGEMLEASGWRTGARVDVVLEDTYSYQIWTAVQK